MGLADCKSRYTGAMKYPMTRFKSLKMALKELEPFIRNGRHLATGRPFKQFGGMLSREVLANWLLCVVINFTTQETEQVTFSSDPIGGDGIIHHDASGFAVPTEHVRWSPKTGQVAKRESPFGTAGWPEVRHGKYTEEAQS